MSETMSVFRIMPENITPLWPQIERLLTPALLLVSTHTAEDVRRSAMSMQCQMWAQMDGGTVEAAATTEFIGYPVGTYVRVWLAGAAPAHKLDEQAFFETLDGWRKAHGCIGFEAIGRHGWLRKFRGAKVEGLIMRWRP